nr:MAG TPA: GTP-binding nuclear protein [Bacteriophage sp.]
MEALYSIISFSFYALPLTGPLGPAFGSSCPI